MLSFFEKTFHIKLSEREKQAEVEYKHSLYKVLVYSLCQDLFSWGFFVLFVRNTCIWQAFNLKFKQNSKTDSFLFIKTWVLKIGLAYSLLRYDIITLLNCKTDLIFIAYSQRSHYIQSSLYYGQFVSNWFHGI